MKPNENRIFEGEVEGKKTIKTLVKLTKTRNRILNNKRTDKCGLLWGKISQLDISEKTRFLSGFKNHFRPCPHDTVFTATDEYLRV